MSVGQKVRIIDTDSSILIVEPFTEASLKV